MTKTQKIKVFLAYLILYTIIGALAAWIPLLLSGWIFEFILIATTTMAILRTIDFIKDEKQAIGIKKFLIAIAVILIINALQIYFADFPFV